VQSTVMQNIASTLLRYDLLDEGEEVLVAFSGGKDSISLSLCLAELGYSIHPIAIDMGYEKEWGRRIRALSDQIKVRVEVLNVRDDTFKPIIPSKEHRQIQLRLDVLDSINRANEQITPCTHCYNTKVIALDNLARRKGIRKVAFGHHMTDACASLLKEGLLRIDRFDFNHAIYDRSNFEELVELLSTEARLYPSGPCPILERITDFVNNGIIDTDEPPRQPLRVDQPGVDVIRPMFRVWEEDLARLTSSLAIAPEGSGCGHGATRNTETPREMIHYRVLKSGEHSFRTFVEGLVIASVTNEGHARRRSRYHRAEDLGSSYKRIPSIGDKL
jgi:predicted PP-loop superfamily ATPase